MKPLAQWLLLLAALTSVGIFCNVLGIVTGLRANLKANQELEFTLQSCQNENADLNHSIDGFNNAIDASACSKWIYQRMKDND